MNDKELVAYHEAGHAIVTIYSGYSVVSASIQRDSDETYRGTTELDPKEKHDDYKVLLFLWAGLEAEKMFSPKKHGVRESSDDWISASWLQMPYLQEKLNIKYVNPNDPNWKREMDYLEKKTKREVHGILRERWNSVTKLAKALVESDVLQEKDIRIIVPEMFKK